jgi:hypothetical protein
VADASGSIPGSGQVSADLPSSRISDSEIPDLEIPDQEMTEPADGARLGVGEVGESERPLTVQQSADLQSSRCPPITGVGSTASAPTSDGVAAAVDSTSPEPFYREVHLTHAEIAAIETEVDKRIADGDWDPQDRQGLVDTAKDVTFAAKARDGEFFSLDRFGTAESTVYNATPDQWYGQGAESRLFEVAPSPDTTYFVGHAAPQGGLQGYAADLAGGGQQAFIPKDTDRSGWEVRPVARSVDEQAMLPAGSALGYDDVGDILVTPNTAHSGDVTVAAHTADQLNPFEAMDRADQSRFGDGWNGRIVDRFAGSIEERVTPEAAGDTPTPTGSAAEPDVDVTALQGPLVSDQREGPLVREDSTPRSVLAGMSDPELAQTTVEFAKVALEGLGVEGVEVPAVQAAGPLAHVSGSLLAGLEQEGSSPISDDRNGPLIS